MSENPSITPKPQAVSRKPMADVLGQVYEQFLGLSACGHAQAGKVIRLTAGHQAKVEEKPEVRKAGGVYYAPTYIVDSDTGKPLAGVPVRLTNRSVRIACS